MQLKLKQSNFIEISSRGSSQCLNPDNSLLIVGTREGILIKINLNTNSIERQELTDLGSIWFLVTLNSSEFYACGASGTICLFSFDIILKSKLAVHTDEVNCIALSKNKNFLFSVSDDKKVIQWNLAQKSSETIYEHNSSIYSVALCNNFKYVAFGCVDNEIIVYSLENRAIVKRINEINDRIWCLTFTPNNKFLISGDEDQNITFFEYGTWNILMGIKGHNSRVRALDISSDSRVLVTSSLDTTIKLWDLKDVKNGVVKELLKLEGHSDWVKGSIFSNDNKKVYSIGDDCKVGVWTIENLANECPRSSSEYNWLYIVGGFIICIGIIIAFKLKNS
ncbi:hypothetical protein SteCoe_25564 [Stentor coeruleus]|uniref:Uncharacterized protein n=1 Tax=Stentor coeruleus TaxID=5963 RepID=A0A1R2BEX2_9CILI|nr:hypothetical protein SteCoe_25564 [Stentor coeruleus]